MSQTQPNAVVLLSGGLDSATVLAVARRDGFACCAISFDYGQRHRHELEAAQRVAKAQGVVRHDVVRVDLTTIGGSALTDSKIAVPKDRSDHAMTHGVPITYVPARNLVFLSLAAALAEVVGAQDVYCGVNAVDYSGYPDCREPFIRAFEEAATLGTKAGAEDGKRLRVHAPLVKLSKAEIIRLGAELGVDYSLTHSCYDPDAQGHACGHCDSCVIRRRGFEEAGVKDPTVYTEKK